MKHCEVISGFKFDGVDKFPGDTVDLPDDVADTYDAQGLVDIISQDGEEVAYAACCSGNHGDHAPPQVISIPCPYEAALEAAKAKK